MAHPLIPQILALAAPVAESLGLEVVTAMFHTHQRPPVLRVDIRNRESDTGLADCERMSRALELELDAANLLPEAYNLEISSPGIARELASDREFISFKGFPVTVFASAPLKDKPDAPQQWTGHLIKRDAEAVHLSLKGRAIAIPRALITHVQLEDGDE